MARRHPFTHASTIIRFGAAHADVDIKATERKTGETKHEAVDLTPSYYMAGREGHIRTRPAVKEYVKAICSLHGIRYGGHKRKGRVAQAVEAASEAVMERTSQHMPMGA
jgi:hypothetical protein